MLLIAEMTGLQQWPAEFVEAEVVLLEAAEWFQIVKTRQK
jgi:hypothetical protein